MRYVPAEEERMEAALAAGTAGEPSYSLGEGGKTITCLRCKMTSHHPDDVQYRYCGRCEAFHATIVSGVGQPPSLTSR